MRARTAVATTVSALILSALISSPAGAAETTAAQVQTFLDNAYVLLCAVLVIFMQAGFALVEAGMTRAKNVANIMMKNMMDFCVGVLAFFAVGYALAFGTGNGLIGWKGFFLGDGAFAYGTLSMPVTFIFQVAFAATAATIVSGAMAERTKFKSYLVYSLVLSGLIYPIVVHWVWGGGWLSKLSTPFHDFAGSTLVHMTGGVASLIGAAVLGPRIGKIGPDGKVRAIAGHNIPFAVVGTFILLVGWYGFNAGSELAADGAIGGTALTTTLSGAAGALTAMATVWLKSGKPDVGMTANGLLGGLVAITAGCAAVSSLGAIVIGSLAGVIVVWSVHLIDNLKIDDPVGAISVHGVCGAFGTVCVGLFATSDAAAWKQGLFYGGGTNQLVAQLIGVVSVAAFVAVAATALFMAINATIGLRVSPEEEIGGLDVLEHGSAGYGLPDMLLPSISTDTASPMLTGATGH